MTGRLVVGIVLLVLGGVWTAWLVQEYRQDRRAALTEHVLDVLLGLGFQPLGALFCLIAGTVILLKALRGG